jgi:hypothetical protein
MARSWIGILFLAAVLLIFLLALLPALVWR